MDFLLAFVIPRPGQEADTQSDFIHLNKAVSRKRRMYAVVQVVEGHGT